VLEDLQASPSRPSDKGCVKVKTLVVDEAIATDFCFNSVKGSVMDSAA
jgi:hypothetical protein